MPLTSQFGQLWVATFCIEQFHIGKISFYLCDAQIINQLYQECEKKS